MIGMPPMPSRARPGLGAGAATAAAEGMAATSAVETTEHAMAVTTPAARTATEISSESAASSISNADGSTSFKYRSRLYRARMANRAAGRSALHTGLATASCAASPGSTHVREDEELPEGGVRI